MSRVFVLVVLATLALAASPALARSKMPRHPPGHGAITQQDVAFFAT